MKNYYRLLQVDPGIDAASLSKRVVQAKLLGALDAATLQEIERCLLPPQNREAYDALLRLAMQAEEKPAVDVAVGPQSDDEVTFVSHTLPESLRPPEETWYRKGMFSLVSFVLVLFMTGIVASASQRSGRSDASAALPVTGVYPPGGEAFQDRAAPDQDNPGEAESEGPESGGAPAASAAPADPAVEDFIANRTLPSVLQSDLGSRRDALEQIAQALRDATGGDFQYSYLGKKVGLTAQKVVRSADGYDVYGLMTPEGAQGGGSGAFSSPEYASKWIYVATLRPTGSGSGLEAKDLAPFTLGARIRAGSLAASPKLDLPGGESLVAFPLAPALPLALNGAQYLMQYRSVAVRSPTRRELVAIPSTVVAAMSADVEPAEVEACRAELTAFDYVAAGGRYDSAIPQGALGANCERMARSSIAVAFQGAEPNRVGEPALVLRGAAETNGRTAQANLSIALRGSTGVNESPPPAPEAKAGKELFDYAFRLNPKGTEHPRGALARYGVYETTVNGGR